MKIPHFSLTEQQIIDLATEGMSCQKIFDCIQADIRLGYGDVARCDAIALVRRLKKLGAVSTK